MAFDAKAAILVLDDLATWQKLNVAAFLATGIAGAAPKAVGEPCLDGAGRAMFGTGHDAASREAFAQGDAEAPDLVGLALHGWALP